MKKSEFHLKNEIEAVSKMNVFFGHQSVGRNILHGISEIADSYGIQINIQEIDEIHQSKHLNSIIHQTIGTNEKPFTKISDFKKYFLINNENIPDVALMKFCYVDTYGDETPEKIFSAYVSAMEILEKDFPQTKFIYVTMPLTSPMDKGFKNKIKSFLGRLKKVDSGLLENLPRNTFNNLLRSAKKDTGRVFDLALVESTKPDGTSYTVDVNGNSIPALYPEYTWDGGHLNEKGQMVVAEKMIRFLADLLN